MRSLISSYLPKMCPILWMVLERGLFQSKIPDPRHVVKDEGMMTDKCDLLDKP